MSVSDGGALDQMVNLRNAENADLSLIWEFSGNARGSRAAQEDGSSIKWRYEGCTFFFYFSDGLALPGRFAFDFDAYCAS